MSDLFHEYDPSVILSNRHVVSTVLCRVVLYSFIFVWLQRKQFLLM